MIDFDFDPEKLAAIRKARGVNLPGEGTGEAAASRPQPIPRKRGRPRKIVAPAPVEEMQSEEPIGFEPAPLITVDEKKLAQRIQGALEGLTGMAGAFAKPYMAMTEEEARDIAEPLSSYLIRRAPDSETVREFVENYDLLAILTGTGAYVGRIYNTRKEEVEAQRSERQRAIRSAANTASQNTTAEPSPFGNGSENADVPPLRYEAGPDIRLTGAVGPDI